MLSGDRDRTAMAHSLLLSLPGTPIFVAGDEIGMGDYLSFSERNPVRTPIHWGDAPNAGVSTADPEELVRPVIEVGEFGYDRVNVDAQRADSDSLLHRIVRLIRARDEHAGAQARPSRGRRRRSGERVRSPLRVGGGSVDCLHDLGTEETTVGLPGAGGTKAGTGPTTAGAGPGDETRGVRGGAATLDRYEYCWVRYGRP
jgi:maltose alpha-D-glucosyltransferase/alpha-amylase